MSEIPEKKITPKQYIALLSLTLAATVLMMILLRLQERVWWCKLGDYAIYINDSLSDHTSQHFFDPYAFTHILHGVIFFWLTIAIFRRLSLGWRFFIAIFAECAWEVLENTNVVIERYRQATVSLDYFGDSIANSIGDVAACAAGFWIAYKLGWWRSLIFFLLTEAVLLVWIRDSLLLNILMLIYPIDALKTWQLTII